MAKILALRTDRLGDIVLASGYLSELASSNDVDLWVSPGLEPVSEILDPKLKVRATPFHNHLADDPDIIAKWLMEIHDEAYDAVVLSQFTHDYANLLALGWVKAKEYWGFANAEHEGHYGWLQVKFGAPLNPPTPESFTVAATVQPFSPDLEKYVELAKATGLPGPDCDRPRLFRQRRPVSRSGTKARGTLVWPGTGLPKRRWPVEHFAQLLVRATGRYPDPIRVGGTTAERSMVEECCKAIEAAGRACSPWLVEPTKLGQTTHALQAFERVLVNDTGIAHLAAAMDVPVDSISGAQHNGRFRVTGVDAHTVFADIPCRRCRGACIFPEEKTWPCVAAIGPDEVAEALMQSNPAETIELPTFDRFPLQELFEAQRRMTSRNDETWSELLSRIEAERRKLEKLHGEANLNQRVMVARAQQAERQRDQLSELLEEAQQQREQLRSILGEAEAQREEARAVLAASEKHRSELQALLSDAEAQRDQWREHHDTLKVRLDETASEAESSREKLKAIEVLSEPWVRPGVGSFISIVTPSYGQAEFIRETIESVANQGYEQFEHLVVDGGSTDGTTDVLKEYPHLRWVSEPDNGQAHAINKGLLAARGDILAYINSDDFYRPGAFEHIAKLFSDNPDVGLIVGACDCVDEASQPTGRYLARYECFEDLLRYWGWDRWVCIPQPSTFWRRSVLEQTGLFDVDCHMALDYDMWLRIVQTTRVLTTDRTLAAFRLAPDTKTVSRTHEMYLEEFEVSRRYWHTLNRSRRWRIETEARSHVGDKLLGLAEHYALNSIGEPSFARKLAGDACKFAPWVALNPRLYLTVLSSFAGARDQGRKALPHLLHVGYLDLQWRMRQRSRSSASDENS